MKPFVVAIVVALSAVSTAAVAAPINNGALTVHGVWGGNSYGR